MRDKFKNLDKERLYKKIVFFFLIIQPFIEWDHLLNNYLKQYGLIVPSTLIRILGIPVLALIGFIFVDKHKKRSFFIVLGTLFVITLYSVFHFISISNLDINLPSNFVINFKVELKAILVLIMPFILMYCVYLAKFSNKTFNSIILLVSIVICSSIFITNLFSISLASYGGITEANFISWFTGIYEDGLNPKLLTSKGWYQSANVLGALMCMLLALLYKVLYEVKRKWPVILLIILHSLCMMMIGTRVSTLGVVLVAVAALFSYIGCSILRLNPFKVKFFMIIIAMIALTVVVYPYTPAIKYQESNMQSINNLKEEEEKSDGVNQMSNQVEQLQKHVDDKKGKEAVLSAVLRENTYLFTFPAVYYDESYPIEFDPEFWNSVLNEPFERRSDGRKLQKLFAEYKWGMMDTKERMMGIGFSPLNEGNIMLEQDGWRQMYTMGIIGAFLFVGPYIILVLISIIRALINFKRIVNFSNLMVLSSVILGLGAAYNSGHVLEEFFGNVYLGFIVVSLFLNTGSNNLLNEKDKVKSCPR